MAGTTIFSVIDYLIAKFQALPELAFPALVCDGFPGPNFPNLIVSVGGSVDPTVDLAEAWANLGARTVSENYRINCYVSSFVGGTNQKLARDQTKKVYDAIYASIRSDVSLGNRGIAEIDNVSMRQTDETDAAAGRRCDLRFSVHVTARI